MATIGRFHLGRIPQPAADRDVRPYPQRFGSVILLGMVQALIVAGWVAIGAAVGFYVARQANRAEPHVTPSMVSDAPEGADRAGLEVLVGIDGSEDRTTLLVIGRRSRWITKRLVGSCATELARTSSMPVAFNAGRRLPRRPRSVGSATGS